MNIVLGCILVCVVSGIWFWLMRYDGTVANMDDDGPKRLLATIGLFFLLVICNTFALLLVFGIDG